MRRNWITLKNLSEDDLWKASKKIYENTSPSMKEVQKKLTQYTPKPYGVKKTYSQDWPTYYQAARQEKIMFLRLLKEATDYILSQDNRCHYRYRGNGRPPMFIADIVKSLCIKSFHNYSAWRTESELRIVKDMGVIDYIPKRSTLLKYMQSDVVSCFLKALYKTLAEPLAELETKFAIDATGISNVYGNASWRQLKNEKQLRSYNMKQFSKLHIITGTLTNVIAEARVTEGKLHETLYLPGMLREAQKIFQIDELSADAGYLSKKNVKVISSNGVEAYIMGKKNVTVPKKSNTAWGRMLRMWKYNQMIFLERYHSRSNVEATFGALKRKFGSFTRSKIFSTQKCDIFCKIVCYNASILAENLLRTDLNTGFIKT